MWDLIVEVLTYREYDQLSRNVRSRGFQQGEIADDPICRFRKANIVVDLLPTEPSVLGFGNRWYALAAKTATIVALPSGRSLRHASAPCFLATKIVAFRDRGSGDYLASHDFEDIVAIVDGRSELLDEMANAPEELRTWIRSELVSMVGERGFIDSLPGMIPGDAYASRRAELILGRFRSLLSIGAGD